METCWMKGPEDCALEVLDRRSDLLMGVLDAVLAASRDGLPATARLKVGVCGMLDTLEGLVKTVHGQQKTADSEPLEEWQTRARRTLLKGLLDAAWKSNDRELLAQVCGLCEREKCS